MQMENICMIFKDCCLLCEPVWALRSANWDQLLQFKEIQLVGTRDRAFSVVVPQLQNFSSNMIRQANWMVKTFLEGF